MIAEDLRTPFVLGLDIGVSSIGWALVALDSAGLPTGIVRTGVHLFDAGVDGGKADPETALLQGREQSRAKPRRDARAMRRQTWRRARRKRKVLRSLMRTGLLPHGDTSTPASIDQYLKELDARLRDRWERESSHRSRQLLPYRLREAAVTARIEPDELGRALYHLAQRRGFLSNRKTPDRDEESSTVKKAIGELAEKVASHEPPTLGAYLGSLHPDEQRLRGRWTSRHMYVDEFERIWSEQSKHHDLSEEDRRGVFEAIFWQRPLKDQSHLVGRCSLIQGRKRAPIAERIAQKFRVLQQVNHLRVVFDGYTERPLTPEERDTLLDTLVKHGDLTVAAARRALDLPRGATFSIEQGGEKRLIGHRTDAAMRRIFGETQWDALSEDDKDRVVHDLRSVREPDALRRIGERRWGLAKEAAEEFADTLLEEGHSRHCRDALRRLVSRMETDGLTYAEARKDEFPESFRSEKPHNLLPPLADYEPDLRNPSVARALTEVRKLVNAVIRRWGKPERIHIELARDLKASRGRREKAAKRMRDREKERTTAAEAIARELGIKQPKRWMVEKWLLAEECGWRCPYTGRDFGPRELLGTSSQFDVEHIWPFSKSLDNSFLNKTICYHEENRNRKKGRSPLDAYSTEELEQIVERVSRFRGDSFVIREKVRRFSTPLDSGFTNRHLQETRYIGRLVCEYVGLLYGGRIENVGEENARQRIVTPSGGLTAWLRRGWGLDAVLSEDDEKTREDHRHHAVDALVVACAGQAAIQRLASAAESAERLGKERPFENIEHPWAGFIDEARQSIRSLVVSHRQSRRLATREGRGGSIGIRGALHEETIYSKPHNGRVRVRKELAALSANDLAKELVVDKRALRAIKARLAQLGESNPAKAFRDDANLPEVRGADGRQVKLRRVRVETNVAPRAVGRGPSERRVKGGSNFQTAVYEVTDNKGRTVWEHRLVTLFEAAQAVARGAPVAPARTEGRLLFTLMKGDYLEMDCPDKTEGRDVFRVLAISDGEIKVVRTWDGRASAISGKDRVRITGRGDRLRQLNARKVRVTHLGEIVNAGG